MFRNLFGRRGKGNISPPMKSEPDKKGALEMSPSRTLEVLQPVLRVATFTGYTHQNYRLQGILGGFVWFIMLVTHGTLDFLAARQVYTYGWASVSLSLVLLCLVCTIFTNRRTLPWLEKGMSLLEDEQKYAKTLNRFEKVFKWLPLFAFLFGLVCGSGIYACLHVDNTLDVKINLSRETSDIPQYALVVIKVMRFLACCYVMSALALFWSFTVCVMHVTGYSMIGFHAEIRSQLIDRDSPVTFRQAVVAFSERGKFVRKSASACRVTLAVLIVYSIASLSVNAFLFLYKIRMSVFAIYALLPSIAAVYPLCMAAWVTKQYSWYLAVVVKAWAERPESSSEEEEVQSERQQKNEKQPKRARSLWRRVNSQNPRKTNHLPLKKVQSNPETSKLGTEAKLGVEDVTKARSYAGETNLRPNKATLSDMETTDDEVKPTKPESETPEVSEDDKIEKSQSDGEKPRRSRREVLDLVLRGAARAVGKMRHNAKKPKFNFEKYISYLQNVLSNIGFDIMGIIVTWNMVSAIIFLEVSVLALFVQESIFGNSDATVQL
ncbi:uncharacterized protein [Montipora foliosa]|uniref:uncharacterized protein n=1 Tax=Montipora foliosa TaxID=591990 RepID=UPI0035F134DC